MGGGRKRRKQGAGTSGAVWQPPTEAVTRLVACHPAGSHIVIVAGNKLRGLDLRSGKVFNIGNEPHSNIRAAAFSPDGQWLLTGGDDKCFRVWKVDSWESCINTYQISKKVSAGAFTPDGKHCIFGDKFGDVHCAVVDPENPSPTCTMLLGHFCSVITSVSIPQDGCSVITTDRDNKVRSSELQEDVTAGSFEINAYCMGHTAFVTCSCFARWNNQEVLVTGGGDGCIMLWKHETGELLGKFQVPAQNTDTGSGLQNSHESKLSNEGTSACMSEGNTEDEGEGDSGNDSKPGFSEVKSAKGEAQLASGNVVVSISITGNRPYIAAVVEGCVDIWILECSISNWEVSLKQKLAFPNVLLPTSVSFDKNENLWVVGGPHMVQSDEVHIGVAEIDGQDCFTCCTEKTLQGDALGLLECRPEDQQHPDESMNVASISQTLGKREYMDTDTRKKLRADQKEKMMMLEQAEEI